MNKRLQILLLIAFCLIAIPTAWPQSGVAGVYDNFTANKQSGDLDGMRVFIVSAGSGYHAIVQIAQGGVDDPEPQFVRVKVKGKAVEFTAGGTKYTGTVSATGLRIKSADGGYETLKRKPCAAFLK